MVLNKMVIVLQSINQSLFKSLKSDTIYYNVTSN